MKDYSMKVRWVCLFLIIFNLTVSVLAMQIYNTQNSMGSKLVRLMYEFKSLDELSANCSTLKKITTDDCYKLVDIDDSGRAIDAYYRFKTQRTGVQISYERKGLVAYHLLNANIDPGKNYLCFYDLKGTKVSDISEYKLVKVGIGNKGVLY